MKNYLKKFLKNSRSSTGFTLVELLVAASITTVVVAAGGYGLVSIMGANRTASAETDRRMELNRSLDFIADEVRQARSINRIAAPAASQPSSSTVQAGTVQSILVLELPNVTKPIVYHVAQPKTVSVWLGPRVIYRWGPNLANSGTYTDPDDSSGWQNEPLVDLIENSQPLNLPNPVCTNSWTLSPPAPTPAPTPPNSHIKGFYVCVDPTRRIAEPHLLGQVIKTYGSTTSYETSSKVFARPSETSGFGGVENSFTLNPGGPLTPLAPVRLNFRVLGGSVSCTSGGPELPTIKKVSTNGGSTWTTIGSSGELALTADTGSSVLVQGTLTTCSGATNIYDSKNTSQVKALRKGDLVPQIPAFGNQNTIDDFLEGYIDPDTGRIVIADNEVIYLYEMYVAPGQTGYDLQDIVVLATVNPSE